MIYDVFISYSSKDQKTVEAICAYLEQHKIRCFVAYRDIPKGVVWARAIVDALEKSRMMVVVFSDEFNISDQVDREIELASEDKKPILTFRISDSDFKGAKKYYLKNLNWIDAYPHPEDNFGSLLTNVAKLLDIDLTAGAVPQPPFVMEVDEKTYQVGDYYDNNGVRGVVFEVSDDGHHGKVVSLEETQLRWCTISQYGEAIMTDALSRNDGMFNTNYVMIRNDSHEYPAFVWCRNKGKNWYLPACEEMMTIYINRDKLNATLEKHGKPLSTEAKPRYWTSTEYNELRASIVGSGFYNTKNSKNLVRAVTSF
ncbi:MAG: TIR domain-containing protein [Bacteroidaceae bacterium]|nr:TIR domain-containing protein [Bacteroidaceae bacterium]